MHLARLQCFYVRSIFELQMCACALFTTFPQLAEVGYLFIFLRKSTFNTLKSFLWLFSWFSWNYWYLWVLEVLPWAVKLRGLCTLMAWLKGSLIHKFRLIRKWIMGHETIWQLLCYGGMLRFFHFTIQKSKMSWRKYVAIWTIYALRKQSPAVRSRWGAPVVTIYLIFKSF